MLRQKGRQTDRRTRSPWCIMEGILPCAWLGAKHRRHHPKYRQIELRGGVSYIPRRKKTFGKTLRMRKRSRGLRMSKLRISMLSPQGLWRRLRNLYVRLTAKLSPCTCPTGAARSRSNGQGDDAPATVMTEGDLIWLEYFNRDNGLSAMSRFTMW